MRLASRGCAVLLHTQTQASVVHAIQQPCRDPLSAGWRELKGSRRSIGAGAALLHGAPVNGNQQPDREEQQERGVRHQPGAACNGPGQQEHEAPDAAQQRRVQQRHRRHLCTTADGGVQVKGSGSSPVTQRVKLGPQRRHCRAPCDGSLAKPGQVMRVSTVNASMTSAAISAASWSISQAAPGRRAEVV